jgi:hypothetical protein
MQSVSLAITFLYCKMRQANESARVARLREGVAARTTRCTSFATAETTPQEIDGETKRLVIGLGDHDDGVGRLRETGRGASLPLRLHVEPLSKTLHQALRRGLLL